MGASDGPQADPASELDEREDPMADPVDPDLEGLDGLVVGIWNTSRRPSFSDIPGAAWVGFGDSRELGLLSVGEVLGIVG